LRRDGRIAATKKFPGECQAKKTDPIQKIKKEGSEAGLFLDTPVDWAKIKKMVS